MKRRPRRLPRQIRPILESSCLDCHGPTRRRGNLRLDSAGAARKGGKSGAAIVPGKPAESLLLGRILADDELESWQTVIRHAE